MHFNHRIPPGTQRVFIGIPIDKQPQQYINELLKPIQDSRRDVRWVPENNRHLTLAFLGDRPISEVDNLIQQFDESYQKETRFQYRLSTLERFPEPTGRIIALTNELTEPLDKLFQITLKLLQRNEIEFERKKFRPHVTLGRIRRPKHVKKTFDQQIDINLDITKITLYQSRLTEFGSIYSLLKETNLSP